MCILHRALLYRHEIIDCIHCIVILHSLTWFYVYKNGTIWTPTNKDCLKLQCIVSEEAWANGICPEIVPVPFCEEDTTKCGECQNKTIVKDECDCSVVECRKLKSHVYV